MQKLTIFFGSIIAILFLTLAQKGHTSFLTVSQLIKDPGIRKVKVSNGIEEWSISENGETSSDEPRTLEHKNKIKGWSIREGDQPKVEIGNFKTRKNTQSQVAHQFPLNRITKPVKNGTKHFILIVTSGSSLNVRQQPSASSPKIGSLHNGTIVPHIKNETDKIIDGSWFYVEYSKGNFGWVSSNYSQIIKGSRSIISQQKTLKTMSPNTAQINEQLKTSNSRELKAEKPTKIQGLKIPDESNSKKITDLQSENETLRLANEKTFRLIEDLKRTNTILRMKERFKTTRLHKLKAAIALIQTELDKTKVDYAKLSAEKLSSIQELKVLSGNNSNKIEDSQKTSKTLSSENDIDPENIMSAEKLSSIQELKVLSGNNSNTIEDSQKTSKTLSSENDIDPENIIRTGLKSWINAWQSRNVPLYLSFYSKVFKDNKRSRPKWEAYRRKSLNNSSNISIKTTDIKTQVINNMVIRVTFIQSFKSDTISDIGMKELTWAKEDGNWKIIKETWKPQY
jgi:hypothetical protein